MGKGNSKNLGHIGNVIGHEDRLEEMQIHNIVDATDKIREMVNTWDDIPVNVVLLGKCGVGKSSFINNMIGNAVAAVGVVEGIEGARSYNYPDNEKLHVWDIPGYSCDIYPSLGDYIKAVDMKRFDIILHMHKRRFLEDDVALFKEIQRVGKPFFIVRSSFDMDIKHQNEEEIRNIIRTNFTELDILPEQVKCYFITNLAREFDYNVLMEDIIRTMNELMQGFQERFHKIIPEDDVIGQEYYTKEMRELIAKCNVEEAKRKIEERLNTWKNVAVNVCILGESGVGKSSFINNMAGAQIAPVGVKEETAKAKSYPHPQNRKLLFWDLPGYGGKIYTTVNNYINAVKINCFDIIIFLYTDRFSKQDTELMKQIKEVGKPFFIVRSRFDIDIQNGNEEEIKNIIRSDLTKHLPTYNFKCYFINNYSQMYDYGGLIKDIFTSLADSTKAQVLAFSLGNTNQVILEIKEKQLRKRIWCAATAASGCGAVPVPGLDFALNTTILIEEVYHMANVLGVLNPQEIEHVSKFKNIKQIAACFTSAGLATMVAKYAATYAAITLADDVFKIIPVIGSIISAGISFGATKLTLEKILDEFVIVAKENMKERESLNCDNVVNEEHVLKVKAPNDNIDVNEEHVVKCNAGTQTVAL